MDTSAAYKAQRCNILVYDYALVLKQRAGLS